MKKINVVNKAANLNILKNFSDENVSTSYLEYKGNIAPCVVFEDDNGKIYFVAKTEQEYMQNKFILPPTFKMNKYNKIKELQDKFQARYDAYLAQYPQAEVASFNDKQSEAVAYTIDNKADTPIIDGIISGMKTKVTKADFVAAILAKVKILSQQEGAMIETRSAIKACTTQAELDKIII